MPPGACTTSGSSRAGREHRRAAQATDAHKRRSAGLSQERYSSADRADELKRALRRHDLFLSQNVLKRAAFDKLHHQEWHGSPDYTEISDGDNVLVTYGGSR